MNQFFMSLITVSDNVSACIVRLATALSLVALIAFEGYKVVHTGDFSAIDFGSAVGALLLAAGGAIKLKESSEPRANYSNLAKLEAEKEALK